jgi:putative membrane protein
VFTRDRQDEVGETPDYRFTLANERTFLAWVRTALALMAAGVALVQYVPAIGTGRHILGFALIALGGLLAGTSYSRWARNERAMRLGRRLPHSPLPLLLGSALALVAVGTLVVVLVDVGP